MPNYDYRCQACGRVEAIILPYEDRLAPRICQRCNGTLLYQFPMGAARGYRLFKPFYCETLDCDVHSRREWDRILKREGLTEAGDRQHGARNWDTKAPHRIEPEEPRGIPYAPRIQPKPGIDLAVEKEGGGLERAELEDYKPGG